MFPFFFFDPTMVLILPALVLALYAQFKVKGTYAKYSQVGNRAGLTGAEVARLILRDNGIDASRGGVTIEAIGGQLTDHYDPRSQTLRLSEGVYSSSSVAALGIAAHEVGHAIQHARGYAPLAMRSIMYPVSSIGSSLAFPLFFIGLILGGAGTVSMVLMKVAIMLFTAAVLFTVITLPVEFNASGRAIRALSDGGYLTDDELAGAKRVLSAAALTYVASALMAVLQLLRMVLLANSRD